MNNKRKKTLFEALEKIKSELMLLGFISLLLTVGQSTITDICISKSLGDTWLPCSKKDIKEMDAHHRANKEEILARRVLSAATSGDKCTSQVNIYTIMESWHHFWSRNSTSLDFLENSPSFCRERFRFYQGTPSMSSIYSSSRWLSIMWFVL